MKQIELQGFWFSSVVACIFNVWMLSFLLCFWNILFLRCIKSTHSSYTRLSPTLWMILILFLTTGPTCIARVEKRVDCKRAGKIFLFCIYPFIRFLVSELFDHSCSPTHSHIHPEAYWISQVRKHTPHLVNILPLKCAEGALSSDPVKMGSNKIGHWIRTTSARISL